MKLTGIPTPVRSEDFSQVRLPRDVAENLHQLARAEGAKLGDLVKAALYAWARQFRPHYGATLPPSDELALQELLSSQAKTEPPGSDGASATVRRRPVRRP